MKAYRIEGKRSGFYVLEILLPVFFHVVQLWQIATIKARAIWKRVLWDVCLWNVIWTVLPWRYIAVIYNTKVISLKMLTKYYSLLNKPPIVFHCAWVCFGEGSFTKRFENPSEVQRQLGKFYHILEALAWHRTSTRQIRFALLRWFHPVPKFQISNITVPFCSPPTCLKDA